MAITQVEHVEKNGVSYTRFPLKLNPVSAIFEVGDL